MSSQILFKLPSLLSHKNVNRLRLKIFIGSKCEYQQEQNLYNGRNLLLKGKCKDYKCAGLITNAPCPEIPRAKFSAVSQAQVQNARFEIGICGTIYLKFQASQHNCTACQ